MLNPGVLNTLYNNSCFDNYNNTGKFKKIINEFRKETKRKIT